MKTKLIVLTLVVVITVVFLGFTQSSYAQQNTPLIKQKMQQQASYQFREEMMKKRMENAPVVRMREFIKSLDLSEEQITEINKTLLDFKKDTVELRNSIQIRELEVKALLLEPQTELVKIRAKLQEIADLQVELKAKTIEKYLEVKDLLAPEQQEKLPLGVPSQIFFLEKFSTSRTMNSFCW